MLCYYCGHCSDSVAQEPIASESLTLFDIGDSLTFGYGGEGVTMSSTTKDLLGDKWEVYNYGVGGENTLTISGRYGSIPFYISDALTIPAGDSLVSIPSGLFSSFDNSAVNPLLQGDVGLNPCYVNGEKYELQFDGTFYKLKLDSTKDREQVIEPGTYIYSSLSNKEHTVATFFVGQNGGFESAEDYLLQIDRFVEHKLDDKYINITSHGNGRPETFQKSELNMAGTL